MDGSKNLRSMCNLCRNAIDRERAAKKKVVPARDYRMRDIDELTIPGGAAVTMTSLELVDFINSQRGEGEATLAHSDFLKKVPQVLGETGAGNFSGTYRDVQNKERPCYTFPKREACLMAMSYSYDLQAKVFDRMTALEARPIDPMQVLSDPAAMRGLLLTYTEKVLTLEHKVEELTPKAKALDRIADADGTMNPTVAAKALQIQPKRLFDWMREQHWIYRRPGGSGNVAYQDKIQVGYLTHKVTTVQREDGTDKVCEQVLVTAKGLAKLSQAFDVGMH